LAENNSIKKKNTTNAKDFLAEDSEEFAKNSNDYREETFKIEYA
jgi:hypothetical protein